MNLFDKIFSYQLLNRLDDTEAIVISRQERTWLKTMLEHPDAKHALTRETAEKLQQILAEDQTIALSTLIIEKAGSRIKQLYHPMLSILRKHIANKASITITVQHNQPTAHSPDTHVKQADHDGLPYKLEYSMVKKEWYLLWYDFRRKTLMSIRLSKIIAAQLQRSKEHIQSDRIIQKIETSIKQRKKQATIELIPIYNRELSRILYAFSSFEKQITYDEHQDKYTITIFLLEREFEYLLSKLRFLGVRVRVIEGDYFKRRLLEASTLALKQYENSLSALTGTNEE